MTLRRHAFILMVVLCSLGFASAAVTAQEAASSDLASAGKELALMPMPAHVERGSGQFLIDGGFAVAAEGEKDARVDAGTERFVATLGRETGIPFAIDTAAMKAAFVIHTEGPSEKYPTLGEDESYRLVVTPAGVQLTAKNALGVLHGLQTFLQLVQVTPQGFAAPAVTIEDKPRFPWRGLMMDVGRHFMPVEVVERNLDGMEAVKLNVMHWHLSEDQGFRVESKVFPLLPEKGSDGMYYTQDQVREVIEYARVRGIRVVPEFDMPCHTSAWFAGYPDLASGPGPFTVETRWGVFDPAMDPTRESTFEFLDKLIGEMTALFPDAYFHVGGDECNGKQWDANQRIQSWMKAHGMKNDAALQSYFTGRVQKLVVGHGRVPEGWDEVLQPDTPRDVVIQSWRGPKGLAAAARQGNRVLLSNGYYIDLNQPASEHYLVDPLGGDGATLTAEEKARVLGGEATMWAEFVTPENVDSRIWPRTAAISERLWSSQEVRDVDSMYRRMAAVSLKLNNYGLKHNSVTPMMLERMSGQADVAPLAVLASVVQPPKGYEREHLHTYTNHSALNHLVDGVSPESEAGRRFAVLVTTIVAGKATAQEWAEARESLTKWRDNDSKLEPELGASDLTAELKPVSQSVSQVAGIGLEALDGLKSHKASTAEARAKDLQILKVAEKPQAVLLDKLVGPVEMLVRAEGK